MGPWRRSIESRRMAASEPVWEWMRGRHERSAVIDGSTYSWGATDAGNTVDEASTERSNEASGERPGECRCFADRDPRSRSDLSGAKKCSWGGRRPSAKQVLREYPCGRIRTERGDAGGGSRSAPFPRVGRPAGCAARYGRRLQSNDSRCRDARGCVLPGRGPACRWTRRATRGPGNKRGRCGRSIECQKKRRGRPLPESGT